MQPKRRQGGGKALPTADSPPEGGAPDVASSMPYPVTLVRDDGEDSDWIATIDALPGCSARGATPDEAIARATNAMTGWLETAKREGKDVPEPKTSQSHSGRLLLRMPQTLHAELARVAEREKVSLNQFITDALAGSLGWRAPARKSQVTRAVPQLEGEQQEDPSSSQARPRVSHAVLVANGILVAVAAVVAIVVLIVVLLR